MPVFLTTKVGSVHKMTELSIIFKEIGKKHMYLTDTRRSYKSHQAKLVVGHFSQCSTTGVTKVIVCAILSVGW